MTAIDLMLTVLLAPVLAGAVYLLVLTLLWRRPVVREQSTANLRCCILVPAHNEAAGIGSTITSLQALDYPASAFRVVVIADNCTDETAAVAAAHGADVIVRQEPNRRGKGWALQYAINQLLDETAPTWDVLVVVDADTVVSANLLHAVTTHIANGAHAVQAAYLPRPTSDAPTAVVTEVAFAAFHLIRSGARERLGLSCGLRGNGMAFRRQLLRQVPHTAFSRTEDLEFGVLLGLHDVRVAFAGETRVFGDMPERADVVAVQRERWIGGRAALARRMAPALIVGAIRRPSLMLADLAIDLLLPPLSALLVMTVIGGLLALGLSVVMGAPSASLFVSGVALLGLAIHVGHAAVVAGRGRAFLAALRTVPGYALSKSRIAWRGLRPTDDTWIRTTREGELK
jgi:1,2-diacylglycerol 3-beta-glucosyltransferase